MFQTILDLVFLAFKIHTCNLTKTFVIACTLDVQINKVHRSVVSTPFKVYVVAQMVAIAIPIAVTNLVHARVPSVLGRRPGRR